MKNKKLKLTIVVILMITVLSAISYGAFFVSRSQTKDNKMLSGCFSTTFTENSASINMNKALPMTDTEGLNTTPYSFTLNNTCSLKAQYYVILNVKDNSFSDNYISYSYDGTNANILGETQENNLFTKPSGYTKSYILTSGTLNRQNHIDYNIKMWLNNNADYTSMTGKTWQGEIQVISVPAANQYQPDITLAYTYNGESTSNFSTFISGLGSAYAAEANCSNGTEAFFNSNGNLEFTTLNLPTACTIDFRDKYIVELISSGTGTVSESSKDILYGKTVNVTATPNTGSYLSSVMCTNGYTTNATTGTSVTTTQNVTVSNNNTQSGSTCTFNFGAKTYDVTGATNNSSYGTVTSSTINYGGTTTLTVTPASGYYLSSFSCTNSYTYSGISTGTSYTSAQTSTINNNNQDANTTCTATFTKKPTSCTKIKNGSNNWSAKYSCNNGTCTMTECWYGQNATGTKCNGGYLGSSYALTSCILSTSDFSNLWGRCATSLSQSKVHGGGMNDPIYESCD